MKTIFLLVGMMISITATAQSKLDILNSTCKERAEYEINLSGGSDCRGLSDCKLVIEEIKIVEDIYEIIGTFTISITCGGDPIFSTFKFTAKAKEVLGDYLISEFVYKGLNK